MNPSIKEVAKLAGVSIATVSHVINDTRNVSDKTRERVEDAIKVLNYKVNHAARTLRSGKSNIIGFVVANLTSNFYMNIARSINTALINQGYSLIYVDSEENPEIEKKNIKHMINQNVDGMIIVPVSQDFSFLKSQVPKDFPCVFLGRTPAGYEGDVVKTTNYEAVYESISIFISKGHKSIGCIGSIFNITQQERLNGYKAALKDNGIPLKEEYLLLGNGKIESYKDQKTGISYELTEKLLNENKEITAIFVIDGLTTIGVVNYLQTHHYRIPDDIALITIDDSFWLSMLTPSITAMEQNTSEMGEKAAEILLDRIGGKEDPFKEYYIETKLLMRESC